MNSGSQRQVRQQRDGPRRSQEADLHAVHAKAKLLRSSMDTATPGDRIVEGFSAARSTPAIDELIAIHVHT